MDLNTITEIVRPNDADAVKNWQNGYAWLAGGTWLFSEPQIATHTLIDIESFNWPSLVASAEGLEIAATCKVVELDQFTPPPNGKRRSSSVNAAARFSPPSRSGTRPPLAGTL